VGGDDQDLKKAFEVFLFCFGIFLALFAMKFSYIWFSLYFALFSYKFLLTYKKKKSLYLGVSLFQSIFTNLVGYDLFGSFVLEY
jgi:hypothetical protein